MRVSWRSWRADPGIAMDAGFAVIGMLLVLATLHTPNGLIHPPVKGPWWSMFVLPPLIGGPLALRRRAPFLAWTVIWIGITVQVVITRSQLSGPEMTFTLFVGGYALGAYCLPRLALAGLGVAAAGWTAYILGSNEPAGGVFQIQGVLAGRSAGNVSLFFAAEVLAFWLLGLFVRAHREAAALGRRNAVLEQRAEQAVAAERARIARELHDIVAHHLSVVVLQAAGAQAAGAVAGSPAEPTLRKIEHSGREALTEMRRLLEVLREPSEVTGLTPQPGLSELAALADSVRAAGLPVRLSINGDHAALPTAVGMSAYRIVQEALTNVLKHAGPAQAEVTVGCADGAVMIEVTDDGAGSADEASALATGQGLVGMRERAAIFGGELVAGPRPGGGFAVTARLPLGEPAPLAEEAAR
jgi:signal transduction histidine kinase